MALVLLFILMSISIFVVHQDMDMEKERWDAHEYWKMKIDSMHKDVSSGKRWVVGTWFYTPSQLEDIQLRKCDRYFLFPFAIFLPEHDIYVEILFLRWETQS